jgi:hypothetical protein
MSLVRFFMLLSLMIWIGGIVYFAAVVAPTVFTVLPTRHLAGLVVNRSLMLLHWIGVSAGIVFLVLSLIHAYAAHGTPQPAAARNLLVLAMLVLTLVSQMVVAPRMSALRDGMGEIDQVAVTDARRVEFNDLHQWSTRLEVGVLLLGLAALFLIAREWAPRADAASTLGPAAAAGNGGRTGVRL